MDLRSGYPFLLIRHGLPYDYPKLEEHVKADVVIIGSGISGALSAYYLTLAGIECIVVDSRTVATGSTCASTSLLQYELDTPLHKLIDIVGIQKAQRAYQLCSAAIDQIEEICSRIDFKEFHRRKSLHYAAVKTHAASLKKEFECRKNAGFDVALLNDTDIKRKYGFDSALAILSQQGAEINAYTFTHALLQYAIGKGLRVYDRSHIVHTDYHPRKAELRTENNFTIRARNIINATGYEAEELIPGIAKLHSTYAICSEQLSAGQQLWAEKDLLWNTADPYLYMRTTADNRIIIGGRDEAFYNPVSRDKLLCHKTRFLVKDFNKLFPDIPLIPEFSWTGTFGTTPTSLPYIGTLKQFPHTYFALGFGGNGITFSLIAAEIIRDMILGKSNKDKFLFGFDQKRKASVK